MCRFIGLKKTSDYSYVYKKRDIKANNLLVLYKKENFLSYNRYGISVSKKVGNSVVRHRLKRQIKEIIRINSLDIKEGYDIVIVARSEAKGSSYSSLEKSFYNLIRRHGLIIKDKNA